VSARVPPRHQVGHMLINGPDDDHAGRGDDNLMTGGYNGPSSFQLAPDQVADILRELEEDPYLRGLH